VTPSLHLVVPGRLDQRTGGYLYDARMVREWTRAGASVTVHEVEGRFPGPDPAAVAALGAALSRIDADARVVVDGLALGAAPEVVESHAPRLRLVALVHHPLADETGVAEAERARLFELERRVLAGVRGAIVTSPTTARRLRDFGVDAERVRVVEPGTDPASRAAGPGEGEPMRILSVGTVTRRKGHDLLVAALARIRAADWRCVCVGSLDRDPEFAAAVLEARDRAGLRDRIRFTGEVPAEGLDEEWTRASLFVSPSWYEGYGMALTEALARGLPIVSTRGGAIPETLASDAARLVDPGDTAALAEVLNELAASPERRRAMAEAAVAAATSLPRWPRQADLFLRAVRELTSDA
jgi:glycosyltransferase involved in cell wall biosynthesis